MKVLLSALLLITLPAAAAPPPSDARLAPSQFLPPAELEVFSNTVVEQAMRDRHLVGVAVAVVQNGAVVLKKGYGYYSLTPRREVDADSTLFQIGSITKTMTWILVMKQVEAGRVQLDDPVNKHLPADLQIPDEGFTAPILVRDLMTHQPGFEDKWFGQLFERNQKDIRTLAQYLREERPRRVREPGTVSSYSNYGVALAGAMLEHITGRSWQDLLEAELILPLKLQHMSPREPYLARTDLPPPMPPALARDLSQGFSASGAAQPFGYATHIAPAGTVSASAEAMSRYLLLLINEGALDGVRIYGPETARALRAPMTRNSKYVGNWDAGMLDTVLPNGWHVFGHDGGTLTHFSRLTYIPELKLGIFIAANTQGGQELTDGFAYKAVQHFYLPPRGGDDAGRIFAADVSRYTGEFLTTRRAYRGLEGFLSSLVGSAPFVAKNGRLIVGGGALIPTPEKNVFAALDGGPGAMVEMKSGRVERFISPGKALERIGFWSRPSTYQGAVTTAVITALLTLLAPLFQRNMIGRHSRVQTRFMRLRWSVSALWLASLGCVAMWIIPAAGSSAVPMYDWPSPWIIAGSAGCLLATLGTIGIAALLPWVLRGSSTRWMLRHGALAMLSTGVFVVFAAMLARGGFLQPWSS
jgi:CubicO group peptidase (beta-lactamase class C family)